jgi:hypothetical protein
MIIQGSDGSPIYYLKDFTPTGPYSLVRIASMWNRHELEAEEMYAVEGAKEWKPVRELIEEYNNRFPQQRPNAPARGGGHRGEAIRDLVITGGGLFLVAGIVGSLCMILSGEPQWAQLGMLNAIFGLLVLHTAKAV